MAILHITHNLGVVAEVADRIYVMYAGNIVEAGTSEEVFGAPRHPYTISLLRSVPRLDEPRRTKLTPISGMPPNLIDMPPLCAFRPRCTYRERCQTELFPDLRQISSQHYVRCHLDMEGEAK